jgi:hypothetical protein
MKTTVKGLIKQHLVKVCEARTAIMRAKVQDKPKKQFSKKKIEETIAAFRKSWTPEACDSLMNGFAILLDAPELSRTVFPLEQFGVIVLEKSVSSHPYGTGVPLLLTRTTGGTGNRAFFPDGNTDPGYTFTAGDDPRVATEAEVVACIDNLNDKQWVVIMNPASIFAAIVAEAMNTDVEILDIKDDTFKEAADGAEIETNGRRITVGNGKE